MIRDCSNKGIREYGSVTKHGSLLQNILLSKKKNKEKTTKKWKKNKKKQNQKI